MNDQTIDVASKELWERAKTICLSLAQSPEAHSQTERYLSMITTVAISDGCFVIFTSNKFASETIEAQCGESIKRALDLAGGDKEMKLAFKVDVTQKPALVVPSAQPPRQAQEADAKAKTGKISTFVSTMPLNEDYTFDEFVIGPSNGFAVAAAKGAVKEPGKKRYNPLFIYGGSGLGKTHLMQAIGNELKKKNPACAICYLTAEEFLNEYVNHMQNNMGKEFRNRYRSVDVLLVDDIQFLQRGDQVQEEFFNTFNALKEKDKQIVLTCDVAPKNLPKLEERLITRFETGVVQEIESPSYETRLAILKKKVESINFKVADSVLEFIADNIKSHVRAMEGALSKVCLCIESDPNIMLTNDRLAVLLKDFIETDQSLRKLTIEEIQTTIAKKYSISMGQILSPERTQSLVTPRQLAMYIAKKYTACSLPEIAKAFNKTHATVFHGVKNITKRLDVEPELKATLAEILNDFGYKISDTIDD